jgi:hypothetical protein
MQVREQNVVSAVVSPETRAALKRRAAAADRTVSAELRRGCIPLCGGRRCDATGAALEGWPTTGEHGGELRLLGSRQEAAALVPLLGVKGPGVAA